ncbi:hypothetical protein Dsin_018901 [Dipteronia sinensis]|uniref:Uncharacterized protein n=1 Tax=Dipteronia sinensis TaxID=43782 RepID=A0AAE0A666_9ROSI|nr:hypothetical protein Dsin_018901 [Dipteronia sinensis]
MGEEHALKHILYTEFDERGTSKRGAKWRSEVHAIIDWAYNSTERKEMASTMCIMDDFLEMKTKDNQGPFSRYTIATKHIEKLMSEMDEGYALKRILYIEVDERGTSKRGAKRSEVHAIIDRAYNSTERKEMTSAMCIMVDFLEMKTKYNQGPFSRYTIDRIQREIEEVEEG